MIKLIKFYSDSCGPCKAMAPIVDAITEELEVTVSSVNIGDAHGREAAMNLGLRGVPSYVIEKDGVNVAMKSGAMSREAFREFITSNS